MQRCAFKAIIELTKNIKPVVPQFDQVESQPHLPPQESSKDLLSSKMSNYTKEVRTRQFSERLRYFH